MSDSPKWSGTLRVGQTVPQTGRALHRTEAPIGHAAAVLAGQQADLGVQAREFLFDTPAAEQVVLRLYLHAKDTQVGARGGRGRTIRSTQPLPPLFSDTT